MRKTVITLAALSSLAVSAGAAFVQAQVLSMAPLGDVQVDTNKLLAETVFVELDLDPAGKVLTARIWSSSGDEVIDAAALAAAQKCLFIPATLDGQPIASTVQIYYTLKAYKTTIYVGPDGKPVDKTKAGTAAPQPAPAPPGGGSDDTHK
jgi:TonB family protein